MYRCAYLVFFSLVFITLIACNSNNKEKNNILTTNKISVKSDSSVTDMRQKHPWVKDSVIIKDTIRTEVDNLFVYGTYIRLPKVVLENKDVTVINNKIINDFLEAIQSAKKNGHANKDEFRKIDYDVYLSDSILSIVVSDTKAYYLSEGTTRYDVYHINTKDSKALSTNELLEVWGMSQLVLLNAIAEQITMPPEHFEPLFDVKWFEQIKWKNIDKLKIYKDDKKNTIVIYPVIENGIEATQQII